jgi:hypothetical protein
MASLKKTPLNIFKHVNTVYKEKGGILRDFFNSKTLSELFNYTGLELSATKKKLLIEVILEKFRARVGMPYPDKIALVLKRPMVSSNKELKDELTNYLKRNFKGEYSAVRAQGYENKDYATFASQYNHTFRKKKKSSAAIAANAARANAERANAERIRAAVANSVRADIARAVNVSRAYAARAANATRANATRANAARANSARANAIRANAARIRAALLANATRANAAPVSRFQQLVRSRGSPTSIPKTYSERMALVRGNKAGSDLVGELESAEIDLEEDRGEGESLSSLKARVENLKDKLKKHLSTRKRS